MASISKISQEKNKMRKDEMKSRAVINLNRTVSRSIPLDDLNHVPTLVKCGRLTYVVDFDESLADDKDFLDIYLFFNENYSKYDSKANLTSFLVKKDAWLSREFIEKRVEIEKAVKLISRFKSNLYLN